MARNTRSAAALAALCVGALLTASACGGGSDGSDDSGEATTITWWHNSNTDPGKEYYEQVAADYEQDHPGVDVKISAFQHEDMLTKLDAAWQSGESPDVYMERGGGELADHVEAGITRDLSDDAADIIEQIGGNAAGWQIDGRTYALPFSIGLVGFWYNTDLFEQAGITKTPTTLTELEDAIAALKAADITPISVGAGDKWPAAHYWYAAALRQCSHDVLQDSLTSLDFSDDCFVKAGDTVEQILDTEPFNRGFLSTPSQSGPTSASGLLATGKVAMELAGHWEPGVMQGLTEDGKGLGEATGWFPFPTVEGGAGDPTEQLGGGDAWGVSETAPDEAVDFVKYLLSVEVQRGFGERDMGLPTIPEATDAVTDPALASLIEKRDQAPLIQLYFDTAFGASIGGAMNDEIALLFAGQATPEDVVDATQAAADREK